MFPHVSTHNDPQKTHTLTAGGEKSMQTNVEQLFLLSAGTNAVLKLGVW